jgi:hypothetical protein
MQVARQNTVQSPQLIEKLNDCIIGVAEPHHYYVALTPGTKLYAAVSVSASIHTVSCKLKCFKLPTT